MQLPDRVARQKRCFQLKQRTNSMSNVVPSKCLRASRPEEEQSELEAAHTFRLRGNLLWTTRVTSGQKVHSGSKKHPKYDVKLKVENHRWLRDQTHQPLAFFVSPGAKNGFQCPQAQGHTHLYNDCICLQHQCHPDRQAVALHT